MAYLPALDAEFECRVLAHWLSVLQQSWLMNLALHSCDRKIDRSLFIYIATSSQSFAPAISWSTSPRKIFPANLIGQLILTCAAAGSQARCRCSR